MHVSTSTKRRRTSMSSAKSGDMDDVPPTLDLSELPGSNIGGSGVGGGGPPPLLISPSPTPSSSAESTTTTTLSVKRRKVIRMDPIEQCQQLYDIIRNQKREDGTLLCEAFIRAPKRRQEPQYFEVVSNPMDMMRIQQKIKLDEYEDLEQMSADVDLMVTNAKAYYKRSTQEHKDAGDLWDLFVEKKSILFDQDPLLSGEGGGDGSSGKGKIILQMGKLARRAAAMESRKPTLGVGDMDPGETSESSSTTTNTTNRDDDNDKNSEASAPHPQLNAQLEEIFSSVVTAVDSDGRSLHSVFHLLPSKKLYPSYYEVIENPIDLKIIATRIQQGEYHSILELEKDMVLMCKNACTFNEPGSQIYKDAKTLKRVVSSRRADIEHGRVKIPTPSTTPSASAKSERIRNRRTQQRESEVCHSAVFAAAQYEEDEEEDEDEDEDDGEEGMEVDEDEDEEVEDEEEEDEDGGETYGGLGEDSENPMWLLYEAVCNYAGSSGKLLSEPFKRLPSRRTYPDYYVEIKNPISLGQIQKKIQRNQYTNVTQVQTDLNIMFENAKAYNRPDSMLYKTAVKLQRLVQTKVTELLENEYDSSNGETPPPSLLPSTVTATTAKGVHNTSNSSLGDSKAGIILTVPVGAGSSGSVSSIPGTLITKDVKLFSPPIGGSDKSKAEVRKEQLKERFTTLYKTLMDVKDADGRMPVAVFMEKPSKKEYPDYYRIISDPIDMLTIEANIKYDKYGSTDELVKDFQRMFNNCRLFNEEGSLIYSDANKLEGVLKKKIKDLGPDPGKKKKIKRDPIFMQKLHQLLDTIKDYKDKNGRVLSDVFQKLPTKNLYPAYYDVIKNPIDLDRICHKVKANSYDTLQQLLDDLTLMLDNACKFNEPDSTIYKDALVLQSLALQTKLSLSEDDETPDVAGAVKEILTSIFTSVYNHQDEEGRCYTDTMAELPETDEINGEKIRAISLDLIKSRLDRGYYKRLDKFQTDMFLCFERARKLSRSDAQLFEDSIELQSFFITSRDEVCKSGETLQSPALEYTIDHLNESVEILREEKRAKEVMDVDTPVEGGEEADDALLAISAADILGQEEMELGVETGTEVVAGSEPTSSSQSETYNEQTYNIGDFIYMAPIQSSDLTSSMTTAPGGNSTGTSQKPNIINIQKFWTDPITNIQMFEGICFFRPDQTYHLPTRKFLEKEVFRSEVRSEGTLSQILGKCWVMSVKNKEYFNYYPQGFSEDDVYVCECRYSHRGRSFAKLKTWAFGSERVQLLPREKPLEPTRIASVFADGILLLNEDNEDDLSDLGIGNLETESSYENVELPLSELPSSVQIQGKENYTFYSQFILPCGPIRIGDYVYVRVENAKKLIARVDSMFSDSNDPTTSWFHGPWFTSLAEVSPTSFQPPNRTFWKNEIFQSSIEDTNPVLSICGRCSVLDVQDYVKYRVTEIPEDDTFVCESLYEEARRIIKKLSDGLAKTIHKSGSGILQDEIYYFRKPIRLSRTDADGNPLSQDGKPTSSSTRISNPLGSPLGGSGSFYLKSEFDGSSSFMEDSLDAPPSVASSDAGGGCSGTGNSKIPQMTPTPKKPGGKPKKLVTGYILYSSEVRKSVVEANSEKGFGDISRLIGQDWKNKSVAEKQIYEDRAKLINQQQKQKAIFAAAGIEPPSSPSATTTPSHSSSSHKKPPGSGTGPGDVDLMTATMALKKDPDWIFECLWDGCDWQFEDAMDLIEHSVQEPKGHVAVTFGSTSSTDHEFQCRWKNCARLKKGVPPFPTLSRLLKHVKDIHILKGNGRIIHPDLRGSNLQLSRSTIQASKAAAAAAAAAIANAASAEAIASKIPSSISTFPTGAVPIPGQTTTIRVPTAQIMMPPGTMSSHLPTSNSPMPHSMLISNGQSGSGTAQLTVPMIRPTIVQTGPPAQPPEPLFISIPPRPQKLLHSEAYVRYIESLHANNPPPGTSTSTNNKDKPPPSTKEQSKTPYFSPWEKTLSATSSNTRVPDENKLPAHWLAHGPGQWGTTKEALWALRDFMMRDMFGLTKKPNHGHEYSHSNGHPQ